jgi:hypothetical protein
MAIEAAPATVTLTMYSNSTYTHKFDIYKDGSDITLTGYTGEFEILDAYGGNSLLSIDTTDSQLSIDESDGALWLELTDETVAGFSFTGGVHVTNIVDSGGKRIRIANGKVKVRP